MSVPTTQTPRVRFEYLDGMRALAAWYVVLHHVWLESYESFPDNVGPWYLGWLRWGHLAVSVFIVLSGFSLVLAPSRHGDRTVGGNADFIRRRAWRILPPYWAALLVSALAVILYTGDHSGLFITPKTFLVYGLLLQDGIGAPTPNGAFWSIAVEWHIYFLFPLLLWSVRRWSSEVMLVLTTIGVVGVYLLGTNVAVFSKLLHFTPQFLALFAMGMFAGRALNGATPSDRHRRAVRGLGVVSLLAALVLVALAPPVALTNQFFWLDLFVGAVAALWCYALAIGVAPSAARAMGSRLMVLLGAFSFSVYLIHYPVLSTVKYAVAQPLGDTPTGTFVVLMLLGVPLIALASYGFYRLVERPTVERRWPRLVPGRSPGTHRAPGTQDPGVSL